MNRRAIAMMLQQFPGSAAADRIARKATKFSDPIQRLGYLRQATASSSRSPSGSRVKPLASLLLLLSVVPLGNHAIARHKLSVQLPTAPRRGIEPGMPNVWVVDQTRDYEIYSNGLRIENRLAVSTQPRSYRLRGRDGMFHDGSRRVEPAGVVFHTTESDQAPFAADHKRALQRIGKELLLFVRNKRAYHFLIDRFGRVHRIVVESDCANHAGNSVWADSDWVYIDLNTSFLGVAFEARMQADQSPVNEAQIHAAKVLTEMLRSKYSLRAENCVTHAQVSVNPDNMRIGWHCDWGKSFPFQQIGLPNNYEQPLPSIYLFGFEYDPAYLNSTGLALWKGLLLAEDRLREAAAGRAIAISQYRALLRKQYEHQKAELR